MDFCMQNRFNFDFRTAAPSPQPEYRARSKGAAFERQRR